MWLTITNLFMKIWDKFPLQLKRSDIDRKSPYFCDYCNRMSMTLVHTGIKTSIKTALGPRHQYHGLYHCKCGKLKVTRVDAENITASSAQQKLIKELKLKEVIVEKPDGFVTYHPEKFHQNP